MATNDQFIKAKTKLMHGFMRALLKALRLVKQNREVTMDTMMKFSVLNKELAARTYDGMIGIFSAPKPDWSSCGISCRNKKENRKNPDLDQTLDSTLNGLND